MSLIESIAALTVEAIVLLGLAGTMGATTSMSTQLRELRDDAVDLRRIEQLLDHAVSRAGAGPLAPAAIVLAEPARVVLQADLDGNGVIDQRSSERTEFYLQRDDAGRKLVHRIGRQSTTLLRGLPPEAQFSYRDADGRSTSEPAAIRLLAVPIGDKDYVVALRAPLP